MIQEVDGQTRLCGLIGYPVGHTLSPVIHNYLAEVLQKNLVYVPFCVEQNVECAVEGAYYLNVLGMNVTVPHKKDVMKALTEIDEDARRIGAVNTLVRMDGGYKGYNTDYLGLRRAMEEEDIPIRGQKVVVLGAGGAANAAVYMCAREGAAGIYILNRTRSKAEALAAQVQQYFPECPIYPMEMKEYADLPAEKFVCIQATSIGLAPNTDAAPIEDPLFYAKISKAMDVIYNPAETKFMRMAREQGAYAVNGLKMLLYQGVTAFELWNDVQVDEADCQKVLHLMEQKLHG